MLRHLNGVSAAVGASGLVCRPGTQRRNCSAEHCGGLFDGRPQSGVAAPTFRCLAACRFYRSASQRRGGRATRNVRRCPSEQHCGLLCRPLRRDVCRTSLGFVRGLPLEEGAVGRLHGATCSVDARGNKVVQTWPRAGTVCQTRREDSGPKDRSVRGQALRSGETVDVPARCAERSPARGISWGLARARRPSGIMVPLRSAQAFLNPSVAPPDQPGRSGGAETGASSRVTPHEEGGLTIQRAPRGPGRRSSAPAQVPASPSGGRDSLSRGLPRT